MGSDDPLHLDPESVTDPKVANDDVVLFITRMVIMFGGLLPYVPQYIEIHKTQNASGFSTHVCMVVVVSSVLRIAYWFGHWFDNSLMYQAFLLTMAMFLLLELCLRVERNQVISDGRTMEEFYFLDFNFSKFWQWTTLSSYIQAALLLLSVSTLHTTVFRGNDYLIEPVGFAALMIESTLCLPQIIKNYRKQSTEGMNIFMVIFWTLGDSLKAYFYFATTQPMPFRVCVVIQLVTDFIIFCQVALYRDRKKMSND